MISDLAASSGREVILCGDLNCTGDYYPTSVDARLLSVLDSLKTAQLVHTNA